MTRKRGSSMEPENATSTDPTAPTETSAVSPTTAPAIAKVTFTSEQQEQVNAIVKQRLAEDRARRAKESPAAASPAAQPSADDNERLTMRQLAEDNRQIKALLDETKQRARFDKQASRRGIDDAAADDLFELFKVQKPSDETQWFEEKGARFGFTKPSTPTAVTVATPSEVKPATAAPNAAAKVETITTDGLPSILRMTEAQLTALGPQGVKAEFEKSMQIDRQNSGAPPRPKIAQRK